MSSPALDLCQRDSTAAFSPLAARAPACRSELNSRRSGGWEKIASS